jgi:TolB protein
MKRLFPMTLAAAIAAGPLAAQSPIPVIAVPPLSTPDDKPTSAGSTLAIAWQATELIASDLRSTADLFALPPNQKDFYSYPEVTAPSYTKWRSAGAKALVTGFVQGRSDGRLNFGCYIYDVDGGRELGRTGFVVAPEDWRRAAHKCSGLAYKNCLLPLWIAAYDYKGTPYRFLVNGVTGKAHGNAPWSWVKITFAVLFLIVLFVIFASIQD